MAKTYSLCVFIRNRVARLVLKVGERDFKRLEHRLDNEKPPFDSGFFWCDTTDGRSVILNLAAIQAVRYLWDAAIGKLDPDDEEDKILVYLRGREEPIDAYTESPYSLFEMFTQLELDQTDYPFPKFEDEDGEMFQLNAKEVDFVIAPKHLLDEGRRASEAEEAPSAPMLVQIGQTSAPRQ